MEALGSVATNAAFFKGVTSWMGDLFSALDYFTGDFMEAVGKGFMK